MLIYLDALSDRSMKEFSTVIALSVVPAFGIVLGGVIVELAPASRGTLARALSAAAGIVLALVGIELVRQALKGGASASVVALAFFAGSALYLATRWLLDRLQPSSPPQGRAAVWLEPLSHGLVIGAAAAVSFSLALVVGLGQLLAGVPQGFASMAAFEGQGAQRSKRLWLAGSFAVLILVAAASAYWLLRDVSELWNLAVLVLTGGLLAAGAMEHLFRQVYETVVDKRYAALAFVAGFALFTLVSSYF